MQPATHSPTPVTHACAHCTHMLNGLAGLSRESFTYGETPVAATLQLLRAACLNSYNCTCANGHADPRVHCATCGRRPGGASVLDLGSGVGNVVISAALLIAASLVVPCAFVSGVQLLPALSHPHRSPSPITHQPSPSPSPLTHQPSPFTLTSHPLALTLHPHPNADLDPDRDSSSHSQPSLHPHTCPPSPFTRCGAPADAA